MDRAGPAEDRGRQLAERRARATVAASLAVFVVALRRARRRRLRAHAPLRAARPAGSLREEPAAEPALGC